MYQSPNHVETNYYQPVAVSEEKVAYHLATVMAWMFAGIMTTVFAAFIGLKTPVLLYFSTFTAYGPFILFALQIGLVLFLSSRVNKDSSSTTTTISFFVYSFISGLSLSYLFLIFELLSLIVTFVMAATIFFSLAVYGFTTGKDLSKFGSLLIFGLFGLIATSALNIFLQSSGTEFIISIAGVAIFIGLIAVDTQKAKRNYSAIISSGHSETGNVVKNLAIYSALSLYLDFINLFIYLLRIFGKRD